MQKSTSPTTVAADGALYHCRHQGVEHLPPGEPDADPERTLVANFQMKQSRSIAFGIERH
jgi:hypothetical protein